MRVLIADDTKMERWLLEKLLMNMGHEVVAVSDGEEALERFKTRPFPMVMLDWMMPKLDGIETLKKLRELGADREEYCYIVMVTSKSEKENLQVALEAGADDFIHKPINKLDLSVRIKVGERILDFNQRLAEKNKDLSQLQNELINHNVKLMKQVDELKMNICKDVSPEASLDTPYDTLTFGEIHLIECPEQDKDRAFKMFLEDVTHNVPGLVISRQNPEKVKEKYNLVNSEVIWLTKGLSSNKDGAYIPLNILAVEEDSTTKEDYSRNLTVILEIIKEFLSKQDKCVVILDGLEYLFTRFSPQQTMEMLYDLSDIVKKSKGKVFIAFYPDTVEQTTASILKKEMNWISAKK